MEKITTELVLTLPGFEDTGLPTPAQTPENLAALLIPVGLLIQNKTKQNLQNQSKANKKWKPNFYTLYVNYFASCLTFLHISSKKMLRNSYKELYKSE